MDKIIVHNSTEILVILSLVLTTELLPVTNFGIDTFCCTTTQKTALTWHCNEVQTYQNHDSQQKYI